MVLLPAVAHAQGIPDHIRGLHGILNRLFDKMMPRCQDLVMSARLIGCFGATFYIAHRVWKHIAAGESIDFYPLFRPFVLGFCIFNFSHIVSLVGAILSPAVAGTQEMMDQSTRTIKELIAERQQKAKTSPFYLMYGVNNGRGDRGEWMKYAHKDEVMMETPWGYLTNSVEFAMAKGYYGLKTWFKEVVSFLLQLLYEAAALCINTLRTFNLLIMALIGPLVFALAIFDGFQHSLTMWLARYINYYLWLPVCNIVGALLGMIQEEMIRLDISQIETYGDSFFTASDIGYLIFMVIGIVCYTTVPSIASMIVNSGGGSPVTGKMTSMASSYSYGAAGMVVGGAAALGAAGMGLAGGAAAGATMAGGPSGSGYMRNKLS